ncbi:MAG: heterodisulfide reductase-related iron-sulfur binding cluster [Tepidiformaceae bacterium]
MAFDINNWPRPEEAPSIDDLSKCVHCGLCVTSCPTYAITGLEVESPRGRIHLAIAVGEGRIPLTPTVQSHWDLCLQCRACEAVCPSGVPYGRIMEHTRAQLDTAAPSGQRQRRLRRQLLRQVIARPRVLAAAMFAPRVLAGSKLRSFTTKTGLNRFLGPLRQPERQLPARVGKPFRPGDELAVPADERSEAIVFTGCIMGELFGDVHRATGRVLAHNGVRGIAAKGQGCCGALHAHDGDIDFARELARRNIDGLESTGDTPIVVNSAGCGAAMKEYGDLLAGDPRYAKRARAFGARVRDATEFVAALGVPIPGAFPERVAYQDPCHLAHAQRIREQPRALLGALTGCELVETEGADMCCGAAGIYSMVQPEMSAQLRERKTAQFRKHRPDVVVTANPGCQMQYEAAVRDAGIDARVMHVMEVLDEAYRAADAE